jgi:hypothetical protein
LIDPKWTDFQIFICVNIIFVFIISMNTIQRRFLLFLIGCIGTRALFALLAKKIDTSYLPVLGYIALLPAIGFLYIYVTGARKTGLEVGGEKIWWNSLRPIHSFLYFLFAYMAITKNTNSWKILAIDVSFGLLAFLYHHYTIGSFYKLI